MVYDITLLDSSGKKISGDSFTYLWGKANNPYQYEVGDKKYIYNFYTSALRATAYGKDFFDLKCEFK